MSTTTDVFTVLGSLATAISAFIGLKALQAVKKQRESSYRPDIIIEENRFNGYSGKDLEANRQFEFTYETKDWDYRTDSNVGSLYLNVYNVGLGAAKNIEVRFQFDTISCISIINKSYDFLDEKETYRVVVNNNRFDIKVGGRVKVNMPIETNLPQRINYILPISLNKEPIRLRLPMHILEIYSILLHIYWKSKNQEKSIFNFPKIDIEFKYKDIGGREIVKQFAIKLNFQGGSEENSWNEIKVDTETENKPWVID